MSLYLDIEKTLGSFHLQVQLQAGDETLSLLGGSGCGKSMTLRCIAGIVRPALAGAGRPVLAGVGLAVLAGVVLILLAGLFLAVFFLLFGDRGEEQRFEGILVPVEGAGYPAAGQLIELARQL